MKRRVLAGGCLLALLLIYLICPFRLGIVCGASMEPTFHNGQPILIDQGYYRRKPVARGDVILLRQDGQTLIKRVFAVGGDAFHVMIFPDEAGVNRYVLTPEDVERMRQAYRRFSLARFTKMRVPPGCVYVLGDNSSASIDSRDFGMVPVDHVIGRVPDPTDGIAIAHAAEAIIPSEARRQTPRLIRSGIPWAPAAATDGAHPIGRVGS